MPLPCTHLLRSQVGTDVDALAVRSAARNAHLNGVADAFASLPCEASIEGPEPIAAASAVTCIDSAAASASGSTGGSAAGAAGSCPPAAASWPRQFDLVVANILKGPLQELRPRLAGYAAPGGLLVVSGILNEQVGGGVGGRG